MNYENEITEKIHLLSENNSKEFLIHIYPYQENEYNIYIDQFNFKTYSLEQIFYSKEIKKFNKIEKFKNKIEDYRDENFMRCNLINITEKQCLDICCSYNNNFTRNKIFDNNNPNILMNIFFGKKRKSQIYLYLNEEIKIYQMNKNDIEFLKKFEKEIIRTKNNSIIDYDLFYHFLEQNYFVICNKYINI